MIHTELARRGRFARLTSLGRPGSPDAVRTTQPTLVTMGTGWGAARPGRRYRTGRGHGEVPAYTPEEQRDALLGERSLLSVSATRARDMLVVSWSKKWSRMISS